MAWSLLNTVVLDNFRFHLSSIFWSKLCWRLSFEWRWKKQRKIEKISSQARYRDSVKKFTPLIFSLESTIKYYCTCVYVRTSDCVQLFIKISIVPTSTAKQLHLGLVTSEKRFSIHAWIHPSIFVQHSTNKSVLYCTDLNCLAKELLSSFMHVRTRKWVKVASEKF